MDITPLVQHFAKFISLDEKEIELLGLLVRHHTIKNREFLLKEGEICLYDSFIVKGCVKIFQIDEQGKEHIISFAIENWWAVDMYSFIGQLPAVYSIQALEDTDLIQFTRKQYDLRYEIIPQLNKFTRKMLENAYVVHQSRILQNISLLVEEKYLKFLEKYPNLESRISQRHIASYLGVSPEFLSRMKKAKILKKKK
ncbi:Crp/Fnr family transcriptional regulator [Sphingobacterium kitahiroshimense]|uniref:Crp/Fnr family transcriptional regulator n=1 Tax=Sphingobacterium kitahiroshimense TaxID=470446 RepID=UPI003208ABF5